MMPLHVHLHWPDVRVEHLAATPGHLVVIAGHEGSRTAGQARLTLDAEAAMALSETLARMAQEATRRAQIDREARTR